MEDFIIDYVDSLGLVLVLKNGNIYVTKGKSSVYPTFVAHTDTVHSIVPDGQFQIVQTGDLLYGINPVRQKWQGIGGDDKVGIFLALVLLRDLPFVKVAFFKDEEIGCVGSAVADMKFFKNSAFVLEADRKGNDDFVTEISGVKLYGDNFSEAIKPFLKTYNYSEYDFGGLTDVMILKERGLRVACANVSCGYYNPHTDGETISIRDVQNTLDLFRDIAENLGYRKWKHSYQAPIRKTYRYMNGTEYGWGDETNYANYWTRQKDGTYAQGSNRVTSFKQWDQQVANKKDVAKAIPATVASIIGQDRELLAQSKIEREAAVTEYVDNMGFSDDETDMARRGTGSVGFGNGYNEWCPQCEEFGALEFDGVEADWFCLVCQQYLEESKAMAKARALLAEGEQMALTVGVRVG